MITKKRRRKTKHDYGVLENRQVLTSITVPDIGWSQVNQFHIPFGQAEEVLTDLEQAPEILTQPENGTLTFDESKGSLVYQPNEGFSGKDTFEVVGQANEFSVNVWHSAYATPDWQLVNTGDSVTIDVLENDYSFQEWSSDGHRWSVWGRSWSRYQWQQDSAEFTIVDVTQPQSGSVAISEDGKSLTFDSADTTGQQEITYTIEDARGFRTTGSLVLDVVDQPVDGRTYFSEAQWKQEKIESWLEQHAGSLAGSGGYVYYLSDWGSGQLLASTATAFEGEVAFDARSIQEGDIVKSQGDLLYYVTYDNTGNDFQAYLSIIDVGNADEPVLLSTTGFEERISDIFLDEGRVAVVTSSFRNMHNWSATNSGFEVTVLDVTSPVVPSEVYSAQIEGAYTDARLVGDQLHLVSQYYAGIGPSLWEISEDVIDPVSPADFIDAIEARENGFQLPSVLIQRGDEQTRTAIAVDEIIPREAGHMSTLVTTLGIQGESSQPVDMDLVESGYVQTVYVSAQSMYLFDNESVIKFSFGAEEAVEFSAEGELNGTLINQFAAHEHDGVLRVASNEHDGTVDVRVFEQVGDQLTVKGMLDDIAPGERIFSTTFVEDQLFVVTFRQIDPLFVIDLSVDSNPVILGELKIPGVSNYLQLIDDDILLAVGRDANAETGWQTELQVSLFDVADPENPQLLDRYTFEDGVNANSPLIDWVIGSPDHQALTFDQASGTLMLPVDRWKWHENSSSNITVFEIGREDGIQLKGEVDFETTALRTVISGDRVVYLSEDQVKTALLNQPVDVLATLDLPPEESEAREPGAAEKVCIDRDMIFEARPELVEEIREIIEEFDIGLDFVEEQLASIEIGLELGDVLPDLASFEGMTTEEQLVDAIGSTNLLSDEEKQIALAGLTESRIENVDWLMEFMTMPFTDAFHDYLDLTLPDGFDRPMDGFTEATSREQMLFAVRLDEFAYDNGLI